MQELTAAEAAKWLGVSREAVDLAAREGRLPVVAGDGPRRFSLAALEEFHYLRQARHVASLALSRETPVSVARRVRKGLHDRDTGLPRSFTSKLNVMPESWRSLFSKAELSAACLKDGEGCRWCKSLEYAAFLGLRPVEYSKTYTELFGGPPCGTCGPGLYEPVLEALRAQVHPPGTRPSPPAPRASAVERELAEEWVRQRPVTASARPFQGQDDDGKALISRRRREVQARLKAARRAGDTKYALRLQQQLQALTADAAAVDYGRSAVTAASRPGTLRCGHALAAGCSCPRRASRRGQR